jgi:hypothetical protein
MGDELLGFLLCVRRDDGGIYHRYGKDSHRLRDRHDFGDFWVAGLSYEQEGAMKNG